jgi:hypothetical protein
VKGAPEPKRIAEKDKEEAEEIDDDVSRLNGRILSFLVFLF